MPSPLAPRLTGARPAPPTIDLDRLLREAVSAGREGPPARARALYDQINDGLGRLDATAIQVMADSLFQSAMKDISLGDFDIARDRISLGFAVASRLKVKPRTGLNFRMQAARVRLHAARGDLASATALCMPVLSLHHASAVAPAEQAAYCLECCDVLRRLGQYSLTLHLLDFIEQQLVPWGADVAPQMRISVLLARVSVLGHQAGYSQRALGPLGWEPVDSRQAALRLRQNLLLLQDEVRRAEATGLDAFAQAGRWQLETYPAEARLSPDDALKLQGQRIRHWRRAGFRLEEGEQMLDMAGSLLATGAFARARAVLQQYVDLQKALGLDGERCEAWQWLWCQCLTQQGQLQQAMDAHALYARLVDDRTGIAAAMMRRALVSGRISWFDPAAGIPGPAASRRRDGVKGSRAGCCLGEQAKEICAAVDSASEAAANLGVSPRRLHQIFKLNGLPPPMDFIQQMRARRGGSSY